MEASCVIDKRESLLIGAHTSISGGIEKAIYEGASIGATTVQIFTANQRQWNARPLTEEMRDRFHKALDETGLKNIMSHDSYLINLGAPSDENLQKSRQAFRKEIERCQFLGLSYLNFHPGAALKEGTDRCLDRIVESLLLMQDLFNADNQPLQLLVEMTAGQGSTVGKTIEEVQSIVHLVSHAIPIGVCIDTCHIFAAGYDISIDGGISSFLDQFDKKIGLKFLKAFHMNDSKKGCGTHVDRHACLGKGFIGLSPFSQIMQDSRLTHLPKYLETPEGDAMWREEIAWLRTQAAV
ncbi:MAG: deoxyribonuclease IV [Chlamydia sp.]